MRVRNQLRSVSDSERPGPLRSGLTLQTLTLVASGGAGKILFVAAFEPTFWTPPPLRDRGPS